MCPGGGLCMGGRCFPPAVDAGVSDAGSDASTRTDGGSRDGGSADAGLDGGDGSLLVTPPAGTDDGCGCRAGASPERSGRYALLGVVGALAAMRRRRRRTA